MAVEHTGFGGGAAKVVEAPAASSSLLHDDSPLCDLSIIIVNWNVCALLERCLNTVVAGLGGAPGAGALTYEVIIIDNGSTDGSLEMLERSFPWTRRLALGRNLGFAAANNRGLAISRGRYLLLLNPDTEIVGPAIQALCDFMGGQPDAGMLGPQLRYPDGSVQPSRRRFPTYATAFIESTVLQRWLPNHLVLRRYYMQDIRDDVAQEVDWLVGACLCLRREAWEQVGPLDERFFMYSEEVDYAWRLRKAGWRAFYVPAAQVIHHEGGSSEQVMARRLIMFHTAKVQLYAKYFGAFRGQIVRLFLLATFAFQWVEEAFKWGVGRKRALRRRRMAAYGDVLRSGLRPARLVPPQRAGE